ncbi:hypothetical protein EV192_109347 [Actinocrispum wychmicini]|uniref:Uncharacterized protein n=1 Tax=Actinocrispum wychmicini TaxID=1213861 RepID=A0A4R2JC57_9PSEU|nr:hypothetical protein EV192_109347 [Actinocrispum wychmicini]
MKTSGSRLDWFFTERAGGLVPVGRGGERRAIALANPGLGGAPYATPTLWAAIQYLRRVPLPHVNQCFSPHATTADIGMTISPFTPLNCDAVSRTRSSIFARADSSWPASKAPVRTVPCR